VVDREQAVALLRAHEAELKGAGVARLSVFGSVARGDATDTSDVDVMIRLSPEAAQGGFAYFGRLNTISRRLEEILGCAVDVVAEPVRKERLRQTIEREATLAF
jgi:predicted nucleotidyltransferase